MATVKLNEKELEFVARNLPAYSAIASDDKAHYIRIFSLLSSIVKETGNKKFRFTADKNSGSKVACIKFIRTHTGFGLKEAKDAFEANTIWSLTDWKMNAEALEYQVKVANGNIGSDNYAHVGASTVFFEWIT